MTDEDPKGGTGTLSPGALTALLEAIAAAPPQPEGTEPAPLQPGTRVGRYEIVRELARGAFGVVYEAWDRELGRSVALKLVRPGRPGVGEAQLAREAEAIARLSHPNLVTVHDIGHSEHGPYLVFELLRGETLEERLDRGAVPVKEAVRLGLEVARGLAYAHAEGVVHRDLKPSNVFVTARGEVKLLDFGMAHAFGRKRVSGGTPAYMAPEQWEGDPEDERTDVFALGVMLYRMLSGGHPFPEDWGKWSSGPAEAPRLLVAGAPELEELVSRMLSKAPKGRPRDGGEVLAALERVAGSLPAGESAGSLAVQTLRRKATLGNLWVAPIGALVAELRRRKVFRAVVGWGVLAFALLQGYQPLMRRLHLPEWTLWLVVLMLAAGFPVSIVLAWIFDLGPGGVRRTAAEDVAPAGGGAATAHGVGGWRLGVVLGALGLLTAAPGLVWYFGWRAPARARPATEAGTVPTLAVLPLANLSGDPSQAYFSDGMTEEITTKLGQLRGLAVTAAASVARFRDSPVDPRRIGQELGVSFVLEGSVRRAGDRVRVSARLIKTADGFRVWSEEIDARMDDIFAVQEKVATRIIEVLGVQLEPGESRRLTDWGTRNAGAYDEYLRGLVLVEHFSDRGRLEAGRKHFERALAMDREFAPALAGLAQVEMQTYRNFASTPDHIERAEVAVRAALRIDPTLVYARLTQANLRGMRFDYAGAADDVRRVTADQPRNYFGWDLLCWVLGYMEPPETAEAERACRKALLVNPGYAETYYHLARVLAIEGRHAEAEQAIHDLAEHPGNEVLVTFGRYWIHLFAGRPREALSAVRELERESPTALAAACEAMALAQLGEEEEAFAVLDRALSLGYRDVPALRRSRWFAPLRGDARFDALLARHGIPH